MIVTESTRDPITGGLTAMDAEISQDGGAFADCAGAETEIGTTGYGFVDLTATETNADHLIFRVTASNANASEYIEFITFEFGIDSGVLQASTASVSTLAATATATDNWYRHAVLRLLRGTGAGQQRTINSYSGASRQATVDEDWLVVPDNTTVYIIEERQASMAGGRIQADLKAIEGNTTASDNLLDLFKGIPIEGNVNDASPAADNFDGDAALSATNDFYVNQILTFTSGTLIGLASKITDYVGSTKNIIVTPAFPSAPANLDTFVISGFSG